MISKTTAIAAQQVVVGVHRVMYRHIKYTIIVIATTIVITTTIIMITTTIITNRRNGSQQVHNPLNERRRGSSRNGW